jgi:type II secretory pathway component PulJ
VKKQRGFTLIEVVVIVGLGSIITLGAMLTLQQVLQNTHTNNSRVEALDDINRVVIQIKRDLQSYQTANLTDLQNGPTTFEWENRRPLQHILPQRHNPLP